MALSPAKRKQIIDKTVAQINKLLPDEGFGKYSEIGSNLKVETLSTGSIAVDAAIGGGIAKGRICNLVGHTSSGKTTLALTTIANLQKEKPDALILFCDAEQTFDPRYAESLGVIVDDIYIIQPSSGEHGFQAIEMFMRSGIADIVVVDSIAAMLPKSIIDRDYDKDAQPGQFSKLVSSAVGRINLLTKDSKCTVILINQWKPVVKMSMYAAVPGSLGNWYQPGGAQIQFYASQIIEVKKSGDVKEGKKVVSSMTTMTCKKNKIAPPYRTATFVITYGQGLDKMLELFSLGVSYGFISSQGSHYTIEGFGDESKTFHGKIRLSKFLERNEDAQEYLRNKILAEIKDERDIIYTKAVSDDVIEEDEDYDEDYDYAENDKNESAESIMAEDFNIIEGGENSGGIAGLDLNEDEAIDLSATTAPTDGKNELEDDSLQDDLDENDYS